MSERCCGDGGSLQQRENREQVACNAARLTARAEPLDAGGLEPTHELEAIAAIIIRLLFRRADPLSAFQFLVGTCAQNLTG